MQPCSVPTRLGAGFIALADVLHMHLLLTTRPPIYALPRAPAPYAPLFTPLQVNPFLMFLGYLYGPMPVMIWCAIIIELAKAILGACGPWGGVGLGLGWVGACVWEGRGHRGVRGNVFGDWGDWG